MKTGVYSKLAWLGIKKNRKLYLPYILTCVGMIMMFYIIASLSVSTLFDGMRGAESVKVTLVFGKWVIGIFSLIFLFYTNSFLMRRRNKEFGLYNILGMNKGNIGKIAAIEALMISTVSLLSGLFLGIVFSKLAELVLLNILHIAVDYSLRLSISAVLDTLWVYALIFLLLFISSLIKIRRTNALDLFHSENLGEKPPKANWFLALCGVIFLVVAYFMAVSIQNPASALLLFFVAVILVIAGTYMLFTAGSVTFCKMLQKNKKYYYKKNHFVSTSSMAYRMKRNGAGLASICILVTMVLVVFFSCFSLYIGQEDAVRSRFTKDINIEIGVKDKDGLSDENLDLFREAIDDCISDSGIEAKGAFEYRYGNIYGMLNEGVVYCDPERAEYAQLGKSLDDVVGIFIMPVSDYNRVFGTSLSLGENEAYIYTKRVKYKESSIKIDCAETLNIVGRLDDFTDNGTAAVMAVPFIYLVVNDLESYCLPLAELNDTSGDRMLWTQWYMGFDTDSDKDSEIKLSGNIRAFLRDMNIEGKCHTYSCESLESNRADFYTSFGTLFFLGILLSIVFLCAAVLIIYYKQMSEGYEDQARFEIMQKVGMTKNDIRRSINSQVLTVFFAPLLAAGVHLAFAFPMILKILTLFGITNSLLCVIVAAGSFVLFAIFYVIVFEITSHAYYSIVSGAKRE